MLRIVWELGSHGVQGGLVHEVGQLGAAHAGRAPRDEVEVDVGRQPLVADVDVEDLAAVGQLRKGYDHLAVESARSQQCRVEDVGAVGGGHHHDALGGLEAVHLVEHLVERLLAFVVASAEAGAPLAADGIDLVDEDDGPAELAGGVEQVADAARSDPDEHLHEVRSGHGEERHAGFAGHGAGDERLSRSRRADEQDALGDSRPDLSEPLGLLEEVDDLTDLLLDALVSGDIGERGGRPLAGVRLGLAPADGHDAAHLALGPTLHPDEEADEEGDRQQQGQELAE